jgi:predicted Rossmann fold flavoprotein
MSLDAIIIGAGAAGLMCAIEAGKRGRRVLVLEGANKIGKKILMSGGGRCNFTNYQINPERYISHNPHFCKSALSRYTQWDFIELVKKHRIPFHEKTLGQLFCDNSSKDIVSMLLTESAQAQVSIKTAVDIHKIIRLENNAFLVQTAIGDFTAQSLVIATGGLSIPTLGSTPFGYHIAKQFGIPVWPTRAGLVPLTLHVEDKERFAPLAGVSTLINVHCRDISFTENMLFTHRGLSGPAILQISSYWQPGDEIIIEFLSKQLPKRLAQLVNGLENLHIKPNNTEGYRTAEVTLGGVDCDAISSKTMQANAVPGLYFIGEVVDVTGWLGGYNFQWAWSSGWAAGQVV